MFTFFFFDELCVEIIWPLCDLKILGFLGINNKHGKQLCLIISNLLILNRIGRMANKSTVEQIQKS